MGMLDRARSVARLAAHRFWLFGNWFSGAVAVGLWLEKSFKVEIPTWFYSVVAGLGLVHGWTLTVGQRVVSSRLAREYMSIALTSVMGCFSEDEAKAWDLRCCVMRLQAGKLKVMAARRMEGDADISVEWKIGQGCCGLAAQRRTAVLQDLSEYQGRPYRILLRKEDDQPLWGMTPELWAKTGNLGSIVSVPLFANGGTYNLIGVVNVDAAVGLRTWLPEPRRSALLERLYALRGLLAESLARGDY